MQPSLPSGPQHRYIKTVDVAEFAETAKIVAIWASAKDNVLISNPEFRGMPDIPFEKREEYVGYATLCLKLAKVTTDKESREVFKAMAAEWLRLAEAAVK
jgi:hypothetical protein